MSSISTDQVLKAYIDVLLALEPVESDTDVRNLVDEVLEEFPTANKEDVLNTIYSLK